MAAPMNSLITLIPGSRIKFTYTNYKGNTTQRQGIVESLAFGITLYHPQEQWFLNMFDLDKQARRSFAIKDIDAFTLEKF